MWLHTYEKKRSYIGGRVNLPKEKHTKMKEEGRKEGISSSRFGFLLRADIYM